LKKLSIIIVNYNTSEELAVCIKSIIQYTKDIHYEIIVVDNNSQDDSKIILKEKFEEVKSFFLCKNMGYSFANNYGLQRCDSEYILILNPDTYLWEDSISKMVRFMDGHPDIGVLGPDLKDIHGRSQLPASRFPGLMQQLFEALFLKIILHRIARTKKQKESLAQNIPFEVDWIAGACFLLRRNVYLEVGGLDNEFFLYNEDVEWCLRIKKAGWRIFCYPKTCVIHLQGASTYKDHYLLVLSRYKSKFIYARKHFSNLDYIALHIIVISGLSLRIVGSVFRNFTNTKERNDRILGYYHSILIWLHIGNVSKDLRKSY